MCDETGWAFSLTPNCLVGRGASTPKETTVSTPVGTGAGTVLGAVLKLVAGAVTLTVGIWVAKTALSLLAFAVVCVFAVLAVLCGMLFFQLHKRGVWLARFEEPRSREPVARRAPAHARNVRAITSGQRQIAGARLAVEPAPRPVVKVIPGRVVDLEVERDPYPVPVERRDVVVLRRIR